MVNAQREYLLVCDPVIHEYVLYLNKNCHKKFVKEDLDSSHLLLIDDSMNEYLQKKIDEMLDENHNKPIEKD
jgi:hypothetical protein